MKRFVNSIIIVCIACCVGSCTGQQTVRLAKDFCEALRAQDKEAVLQTYPEAAKADSLIVPAGELAFNVTTYGEKNVIALNDDCMIVMEKDKDGKLKIVDSNGLFYFAPERIDFGVKSGWISSEMTDQEIAGRFSDNGFIEYLVGKFKAGLRVKSIVSRYDGDFADSIWTTTIANDTGVDIDGADYTVITRSAQHAYHSIHRSGVEKGESGDIYPGVDIKNGATRKFEYPTFFEEGSAFSTVRFTVSDSTVFSKYIVPYFQPDGGEYEEYNTTRKNW